MGDLTATAGVPGWAKALAATLTMQTTASLATRVLPVLGPAITFAADRAPTSAAAAARLASLVEAAFATFDRVVAAAPAELRKGPRGGGRDRDKVVEHVEGAHGGYSQPAGARVARGATDADRRAAMLAVIGAPSDGSMSPGGRWPPRYAARRIAWHAIDHAWEIEDRSEP